MSKPTNGKRNLSDRAVPVNTPLNGNGNGHGKRANSANGSNGQGNGHGHGHTAKSDGPVLITGGSGFIGTNLAHRILSSGRSVLILDNLSRRGVERNLRWLQETHGDRVQIEVADV